MSLKRREAAKKRAAVMAAKSKEMWVIKNQKLLTHPGYEGAVNKLRPMRRNVLCLYLGMPDSTFESICQNYGTTKSNIIEHFNNAVAELKRELT